ncbi:YbaK/EbsC family protein [Ruania suaedae]|uniref:aminoacyl-tRNA deacylase n=1 Tax=Ruania suaedae TaxID=2897774 RepID=UPI001E313DA4|nr:YbaK/EbsC family protein [Ruania suaedae]UFU02343.1 YbaK/EbsC family protein [Ruania suaedae]
MADTSTPALEAVAAAGLAHEITRHGPVSSLEEAAAARGLEPDRLVKTMVVRRGEDDYLFVLVPGTRSISWPRLRSLLGANRLSMPDAATAKEVTGYERGTITPFGATRAWPVIADERLSGRISIGGGGHGIGLTLDAADLLTHLQATVADVTDA